jgi:hypothetical protein
MVTTEARQKALNELSTEYAELTDAKFNQCFNPLRKLGDGQFGISLKCVIARMRGCTQ